MELKLVRDGGTLTRLPVARSWGQWVTPGALDGLERRWRDRRSSARGSTNSLKSHRDVVLGSLP